MEDKFDSVVALEVSDFVLGSEVSAEIESSGLDEEEVVESKDISGISKFIV